MRQKAAAAAATTTTTTTTTAAAAAATPTPPTAATATTGRTADKPWPHNYEMNKKIIFTVTKLHCHKCFSSFSSFLIPERSGDWVLELEPPGLPVNLERHDVHVRVVELHPGQAVAVRGEPQGAGVRKHLLLVHPVGDAVENSAGDACMPGEK